MATWQRCITWISTQSALWERGRASAAQKKRASDRLETSRSEAPTDGLQDATRYLTVKVPIIPASKWPGVPHTS
jgi:hypothetical protein